MKGFLIAAPQSGSGKTTVTLGLLRALRDRGVAVAPAKAGPDYIDPAFHEAAGGRPCVNLDPWAMRPELISALAAGHTAGDALLVAEGMMGLFDGAADGTGSAADLAAHLALPVLLVVDCRRMSHSVAAIVRGFRDHRADVPVSGVVLNRVGSARHEAMLRDALETVGMPVIGALPADDALALPSRHLGLVQAGEHAGLERIIAHAAERMAGHLDLDLLLTVAAGFPGLDASAAVTRIAPPGGRVAVARDEAFAFSYPHVLDGWRGQGAEISFFSPLADEAPAAGFDAVYLPGGYPELHGRRLAAASRFRRALREAAASGVPVYGECGGYMAMGEALIDADGVSHEMLGLLPLVTSFAQPKRHLGYRRLRALEAAPFAGGFTAHEFHYATTVRADAAPPLFAVSDAAGNDLGQAGQRVGAAAGSFMHLIDVAGRP